MSVTFAIEGDEETGLAVDVHNANAARLLDALGLADAETGEFGTALTPDPLQPPDMCGTADPDDFLGRVLVALACAPEDEGRPALSDGRNHYGSRAPGYLQTRLAELHALAAEARARGRRVTWG
ncbi:hypothetical protein ACU686_26630 [Yinghuangia aomiensis]